jgi:hypothetical protein
MEPRRRRLLGDAVPLIAEIDESDSKLFIWAQILHDFPFFSQLELPIAAILRDEIAGWTPPFSVP